MRIVVSWCIALLITACAWVKIQGGQDLTVSGMSSGGYMASILQVVHSGRIRGSAIFAGGVYYCSQGDINQGFTACMDNSKDLDVLQIVMKTEEFFKKDLIDDPKNLRFRSYFAWTGANDTTVKPSVSKKWVEFLDHWAATVKTEWTTEWVHAYPTDDPANPPKDTPDLPFINNCGYNGAYESLSYLFNSNIINSKSGSLPQNLYKYDQRKYSKIEECMHPKGLVYVPTDCHMEESLCPIHISMHGWMQTIDDIGLAFSVNTHLNDLAERNNIIIVYPQSGKSDPGGRNPKGCFDWWGFCDNDKERFATNEGVQVRAIMDAVIALQEGKLELEVAEEYFEEMKERQLNMTATDSSQLKTDL